MPSDLKWGLLGGLIVLVVGALALGCGVMLEGA